MERTKEMQSFLEKVFPGQEALVKHGKCPICSATIYYLSETENEFRDALSKKEFDISGLCQQCQDEVFGE